MENLDLLIAWKFDNKAIIDALKLTQEEAKKTWLAISSAFDNASKTQTQLVQSSWQVVQSEKALSGVMAEIQRRNAERIAQQKQIRDLAEDIKKREKEGYSGNLNQIMNRESIDTMKERLDLLRKEQREAEATSKVTIKWLRDEQREIERVNKLRKDGGVGWSPIVNGSKGASSSEGGWTNLMWFAWRYIWPAALWYTAYSAYQNALGFDKEILQVNNAVNASTPEQQSKIRESILSASSDIGVDASEYTKMVAQLMSTSTFSPWKPTDAGYDQKLTAGLEVAKKLALSAKAGWSNANEYMDAITYMANGGWFDLRNENDLKKMQNVIATTQKIGKGTMQETAQAMSALAPYQKTSGMDIEEISAMYAKTTNSFSPAMAKTAVEHMLKLKERAPEMEKYLAWRVESLQKYTGTKQIVANKEDDARIKSLLHWGARAIFYDEKWNAKNSMDIFKSINTLFSWMKSDEGKWLLMKWFSQGDSVGGRAIKELLGTMKDETTGKSMTGAEMVEAMTKAIRDTKDSDKTNIDNYNASMSANYDKMMNEWKNAWIKMIYDLRWPIDLVVKWLGGLASAIDIASQGMWMAFNGVGTILRKTLWDEYVDKALWVAKDIVGENAWKENATTNFIWDRAYDILHPEETESEKKSNEFKKKIEEQKNNKLAYYGQTKEAVRWMNLLSGSNLSEKTALNNDFKAPVSNLFNADDTELMKKRMPWFEITGTKTLKAMMGDDVNLGGMIDENGREWAMRILQNLANQANDKWNDVMYAYYESMIWLLQTLNAKFEENSRINIENSMYLRQISNKDWIVQPSLPQAVTTPMWSKTYSDNLFNSMFPKNK